MDNQRTILWALFAAMAFITWAEWNKTFSPPAPVEVPVVVESDPTAPAADDIGLPDVATDRDDAAPTGETPVAAAAPPEEKRIRVATNVLDLEISTRGGTLVAARLPRYPKSKAEPDIPVQLLTNAPGEEYVLVSGLVDGKREGPTHLTPLETAADTYVMSDDQDVLRVPLTWRNADGVVVEKAYYFYRDRYDIDVEYTITNGGKEPWRALSYLQLRLDHQPIERSMFNVDSYSFDGPVVYDGESYEKLDLDDLEDEPINQNVVGGWLAAIEHHFLSALVPPADETFSYDSKVKDGKITLRATGPTQAVAPGETRTLTAQMFVGPKLQDQLEETAEGLPLTVDYGVLAILAQPLFWLLSKVHDLIGNWGWSIIVVTFLIKLVFYKLTEASGRSMAKMRKLQPRLKALQERYKDDRQALSQHMMDLYKREKVNPAAGCLPMLVQIPFFIAFYWVLLESVEMRQAPFALWINDLSARDPYFILPLLMGIAMFVQQKLNPAPPDPVQAKVMTILPVMFTVFFAFFPSGLVLYWLTNSVLSVAQQWNINRKMGADG